MFLSRAVSEILSVK